MTSFVKHHDLPKVGTVIQGTFENQNVSTDQEL